jgi:transcriptional regulator with XRE-family HTH domain
MDIRQRLAANIVRLRKEKDWSQEELADRAGLHRTYISAVERCVRNPTITVVEKIAGALGVKAGALLE